MVDKKISDSQKASNQESVQTVKLPGQNSKDEVPNEESNSTLPKVDNVLDPNVEN